MLVVKQRCMLSQQQRFFFFSPSLFPFLFFPSPHPPPPPNNFFLFQIPLIKLIERDTNCMVDISFNTSSGPENTEIVLGFLREHAELRPLLLVLKYFLSQNRLNEPYWGGMGSYALVLLTTFIIKRKKSTCSTPPTEMLNLGELLLEFFHFFGKELKTESEAVSVKNTLVFTKESRGWFDPANPLAYSVEDPQNPGALNVVTFSFLIELFSPSSSPFRE